MLSHADLTTLEQKLRDETVLIGPENVYVAVME